MRQYSTDVYLDIIEENKGRKDLTLVVDSSELYELLSDVVDYNYDEVYVSNEGEYHYVAIMTTGRPSCLYVENLINSEGSVKRDSTDILVLPKYIPQDIADAVLKGEFERVINIY